MLKYRFKMPEEYSGTSTSSFGIEPYYVRQKDGREVKAGKAIIRCVIYNNVKSSRDQALKAATRICELLNGGRQYWGPKFLHFLPRLYGKEHFSADNLFMN